MKKQFGIKGCYMIDSQVVSLIHLSDILGEELAEVKVSSSID